MAIKIISNELLQALETLIPGAATQVRRVVIDIKAGEVPIVHIERFGDERLIDVVRALEGVEIREADATEPVTP